MDEKTIINLDDSSNRPKPRPLGILHTFYVSGVIEDAKQYNDWFEVIRNANETDIIKLHINSPGGDLFTAIQFMRVLNESDAVIVASVEGACMSAATMIFLCANQFEISEHSMFMFHNYSGIAFGKGGEMYDNITHERKWSEKIMRNVYKDFLTEEEIKAILDNKDIWMEGEEVLKRLKNKQKVFEEKRMRKTNGKKPDPKL
jgi:ATP-dependent protease ClpP protease subunit